MEIKMGLPKKLNSVDTSILIRRLRENLDECTFNNKVITVRKVGETFSIVVIEFDYEHLIGKVLVKKVFTKSKAIAYATVQEINFRLQEKLPLTAEHRKLIGDKE
jgi:hypothetical protein